MSDGERPWMLIASNLHAGGGVQVAASLLDEIAQLSAGVHWSGVAERLHCEVSTQVLRNILPDTVETLSLHEVNRRPGGAAHVLRDVSSFREVAFTVFGPLYSYPRADRRLMGHADVTSIYPDPSGTQVTRAAAARRRLRAGLSRLEATRQDELIVETGAMRARLRHVLGGRCPRTHVIPNAVNAQVLRSVTDEALAARLDIERRGSDILLSFPTRAYPHKNLEFLPAVHRHLLARGVKVRFIVTLREEEWNQRSSDFRHVCANLGEVSVGQIATVMKGCDGVFFPSLLEAYSATPVEALALGVPLFASDRDFVRTTCGAAASYFDPLDAEATAATLCAELEDDVARNARVERGIELSRQLPTATDRASATLALMAMEEDGS